MESAFLRVLRIGPFRNLWLSQIISQVFLNLLFFSLMIRVYQLTGSNSAVSLMVLLVTLPNILLGAVAGVLVDRGDRKIVMFLSHFLRVLAVLAVLLSAETVGWLYLFAFLISVITQFFFPAEASTIHEVIADKKLLLTANSLFTMTFFVSVLIGNILAGPFLRFFGDLGTFCLVSVAFLVSALFTARLPGTKVLFWFAEYLKLKAWKKLVEDLTHFRNGELFSDFLTGLDHIYKNPQIGRAIYVMGVSQITIGVMGTIAPGFADKILKLAVSDVSLFIMAPAAMGMIFGSLVVGQFFQHSAREKLIRSGFLVVSLGLLVYGVIDKIGLLSPLGVVGSSALVLVILGGANAFLNVPVNTTIQENSPDAVRSRVFGVLNTVIGLAAIIPIVLAGVFADMVGVRVVMVGCGLLLSFLAVRDVLKQKAKT